MLIVGQMEWGAGGFRTDTVHNYPDVTKCVPWSPKTSRFFVGRISLG